MADSASFISQLNVALPPETATFSQAAARWQHIKRTLQTTLPNLNSEVSATPFALNALQGLTSDLQTQINNVRLTRLDALSASFYSQLSSMAVNVTNTNLSVSGTAVNTIAWDGSGKYVQSDTPAGASEGDTWFEL